MLMAEKLVFLPRRLASATFSACRCLRSLAFASARMTIVRLASRWRSGSSSGGSRTGSGAGGGADSANSVWVGEELDGRAPSCAVLPEANETGVCRPLPLALALELPPASGTYEDAREGAYEGPAPLLLLLEPPLVPLWNDVSEDDDGAK